MLTDWIDGGGNAKAVDVKAVFDSKVPELVAQCVELGALVSIGATSDGGALGVTITLDGRWRREYFRDSEELTTWLEGAVGFLEAVGDAPRASTGRRKRRDATRTR
jgi:hypothetical protein